MVIRVSRPGKYRIATRWSPYWSASTGCLTRSANGLVLLRTRKAATVQIVFDVDTRSLLGAIAGTATTCR